MPNVCNYLHMPAQSGSSSTLQRMKRGYTREAYDALVARAREVIPNVALSTDMITGNEGMPCRTRLRLSRCLSVQGRVYIERGHPAVCKGSGRPSKAIDQGIEQHVVPVYCSMASSVTCSHISGLP